MRVKFRGPVAVAAQRARPGVTVSASSRPASAPGAFPLPEPPLSGRAASLQAFAQAVTTGEPPAIASTADDNLGSIAFMEAMLESARTGSPRPPLQQPIRYHFQCLNADELTAICSVPARLIR